MTLNGRRSATSTPKNQQSESSAQGLAKLAEMPSPDRALAEGGHAIVTTAAPDLAPKLWYGQPAYAKAGKVVCFFRSGQMDKTRYSVFGFNEEGVCPVSGVSGPTRRAKLGERTSRR